MLRKTNTEKSLGTVDPLNTCRHLTQAEGRGCGTAEQHCSAGEVSLRAARSAWSKSLFRVKRHGKQNEKPCYVVADLHLCDEVNEIFVSHCPLFPAAMLEFLRKTTTLCQ